MVYQKCNPSFQSQYAYLDNHSINITDYLNNRSSYAKSTVCCNKGHELVAVNSENRKKHFRHKNSSDMEGHPMTPWHAEWQGHFPVTEITFPRVFLRQVRERRADVVVNNNIILEIQHSKISPEEVFSRKNDYSLHDKEVVWLIDGNNNVEVKELIDSNRVFLYFSTDFWKYKSFDQYDFIFIDIQEKIYKVHPSHVKGHMTDVAAPKLKEDFIEALKSSVNLWDDSIPPQCELYVNQQGAGNGKTYSIIQNIKNPKFSHYETFIYVTKQHSAKYVMFKELIEQIEKSEFDDYICTNMSNDPNSKQFVYNIKHKETGDLKKIIFATIDSFMFSIGQQDNDAYDTFLGIVNKIIKDTNGSNLKITNSSITFAKNKRELTKKTIFMVDECQDLATEYARAIIKVMRTTYIDCLVVGDILQSIHFEQNAFRYFMSDINDDDIAPFIKRTKIKPINLCRRFNRTELVDFVNKVVNFNFDNYNLPKVSSVDPEENTEKSIHFFPSKNIDIDDISVDDSEEIENIHLEETTKQIEMIMNLFEKEVVENKRKPNNFLFVTPFTTNNLLAQELELRIHLFWEKYLDDSLDSNFKRYAIFHRSQEGTSINLAESDNATRIVSCHSAKGDGREVVFLLGFTEKAINVFSKRKDSIIFESMINVAMTRMKQKLYIQYVPNGDILHRRYYEYCCSIQSRVLDILPVLPSINKRIYLSKLIDNFDGTENWEFFQPIAAKAKYTSIENKTKEKKIIDMGHHSIRSYLMEMRFMISIVVKERKLNDRKKQCLRVFEDIGKAKVRKYDNYSKYFSAVKELTRFNKESKKPGNKVFPLLELRGKTLTGKYYIDVLMKFMTNSIEYADDFSKGKTSRIPCPFEMLVLYFIKELQRKGSRANLSIFSLYDILDKYDHGFHNSKLHTECPCNEFFKENNENITSLDIFHVSHYEKLHCVEKNLDVLYETNPKITWLTDHPIYYNGKGDDFKLVQYVNYLAYDDEKKEVFLCHIKPQHNPLNEKDTLMKIIIDTWLLMNYEKNDSNHQKYAGKKVKGCIISLDNERPIIIDIEKAVQENETSIHQLIFDRITSLLSQTNDAVYSFYKYYREKMISDNKTISKFCKDLYKRIKENSEIQFINDFFNGYLLIENDKISNNIKESILKDYDEKDKFTGDLREKICKDVAAYLQVELEIQENND